MNMIKLTSLAIMLFFSQIASASGITPAGIWKTFDDQGKATGFIRIKESQGVYTGYVEKGLPEEKEDQYCTACKDERKNQKLIGMTMMKNVKAQDENYLGDEILDPFSGNTYRVKLKLKEAGNKLEVRGFVGLSLFGRTQVWERVENGQ